MKAVECCFLSGYADARFVAAGCSMNNQRHEQQDRYVIRPLKPLATDESKLARNLFQQKDAPSPALFCGVFDGHQISVPMASNTGHSMSDFVACNLPLAFGSIVPNAFGSRWMQPAMDGTRESIQRVCLDFDRSIIDQKEISGGGSTAAMALFSPFDSDDRLILINIGDSRSLIFSRDANDQPLIRQPLMDHKPASDSEKKRIERSGAHLDDDGSLGGLSVARAFGDAQFKTQNIFGRSVKKQKEADGYMLPSTQQPITAMPDVAFERLAPNSLLLLVSDGITDILSNQDIASIFHQHNKSSSSKLSSECDQLSSELMGKWTEELCQEALKRGSRDNLTALLVARKSITHTSAATAIWRRYTDGPYYSNDVSFHEAFVKSARLYGLQQNDINALIQRGKLIVASTSQK